jgi:hypothetical protein
MSTGSAAGRRGSSKSQPPDWDDTFLKKVLAPSLTIDALREIFLEPTHPLHNAINDYKAKVF